jgi:hypothetical protein
MWRQAVRCGSQRQVILLMKSSFLKNKTLGECSVLPCPCPPDVQARAPYILSVPVKALHLKSIPEEAVEPPKSKSAKVPVEGPQVAPP